MYQIIFIVVFIAIIGICAYSGTRQGFFRSLNSFLRIALPMLLSGIIVLIASLISKERIGLISYIIGLIGTIIFYLVLRNVIKDPDASVRNAGIVDYFLGFIVGVMRGWVIAGFLVVYIDFFCKLLKMQTNLQNIIDNQSLFIAIKTPIDWILFLSFIKL
ncbi:MAG: hypothetical protein ABSG94_11015 [Brevinematales bacterium]|jgi:hypothetical protein